MAQVHPQPPVAEGTCREDAGELAWILPGEHPESAQARLQALATDFARQSAWSGLIELKGTVAWGLAGFPQDASDAQGLLRRACDAVSAKSAASG